MVWPIVAAAGTGLKAYGDYRNAKNSAKNSGYDIDPYGAWNPEQRAMVGAIGPTITDRATNQSVYGGEYNTNMSEQETAAMNQQSRLSAMGEGWAGKFQPGEINPEVDANEWRNLNKKFYGDGFDPGVKALTEEQFAGTGGYWGGARAKGVVDAYGRTVSDPYQDFRSEALQKSYGNALAYQEGQGVSNKLTGEMTSVPRQIKDFGLQKRYDEFVRGREEMATYVNDALNFLSLSSVTATPKKQKVDPWSYALTGAGSLLQSYGMGNMGSMASNSSTASNSGSIMQPVGKSIMKPGNTRLALGL